MNGLGNAFTVSLVVVLLASPSARRAVGVEPDNALQGLMSEAEPGAVVEVPAGVHRSPLTIDKALTLKGKSPEECVVELTADESAVLVSSKAPVVIDSTHNQVATGHTRAARRAGLCGYRQGQHGDPAELPRDRFGKLQALPRGHAGAWLLESQAGELPVRRLRVHPSLWQEAPRAA